MPYCVVVDGEGRTTLLCWGFSAQDVDFGADRIVGFNDYAGALERLREVLREQLPERWAPGRRGHLPALRARAARRARRHRSPSSPRRRRRSPRCASSSRRRSSRSCAAAPRSSSSTASELFPLLRAGMSRREIMLEARTRLMRNGATGISHLTFSFGNSNPEVEADEPLERGSLVTLDLGGICEGYCSDNRRYAYVGDPPDALVEHYRMMVGDRRRRRRDARAGNELQGCVRHGRAALRRERHPAARALHARRPQHRPRDRGGVARRRPRVVRQGRHGDQHRALLAGADGRDDRERGDLPDPRRRPASGSPSCRARSTASARRPA